MKRKLSLILTCCLIAVLLIILLVKRNERSELRLALDNPAENLDPAKAYSDDSLVISAQVMEPLFQYHYLKRPYEVVPLVAEGLPTVLDKGKTIRIEIKKGVFFHDHPSFKGLPRELKAQDFVTQFKRLALDEVQSPGRSLFADLILGFDEFSREAGSNWKKISELEMLGIKAVAPWTLEFKLNRPESNFIYYLALNFTSPVPWEIVNHHENKLDDVLIGTGPYIYKGFKEDYYEMEKNNQYREAYYPSSGDRYANVQNLLTSSKEKLPFIDAVRFYVTSHDTERWEKFINREIDLLNVPKTYIPSLYDEKGEMSSVLVKKNVELKHFPILANRWLAFNMKDPLLGNNGYLRRAIAYSINYPKYIETLSQNTNLRANSILVPGIPGYLPTQQFRFNYNPVLAREYLKMAGFDSPHKMPTITYSTRGNQGISIVEAELIKEMLEDIGLKVKIQVLSFAEFLSKGRAGELMFFTDNWMFDYPNAENILQLLVSTNSPGINKSAYSHSGVDKLYNELKQTMASEKREEIIHQIEEIVFADLPWIPMMYESTFVLHYPQIKNFRKSSIIRNYVKYLKIEK
jgi:oligopeptide transport system substrate-binding protein